MFLKCLSPEKLFFYQKKNTHLFNHCSSSAHSDGFVLRSPSIPYLSKHRAAGSNPSVVGVVVGVVVAVVLLEVVAEVVAVEEGVLVWDSVAVVEGVLVNDVVVVAVVVVVGVVVPVVVPVLDGLVVGVVRKHPAYSPALTASVKASKSVARPMHAARLLVPRPPENIDSE